MDLSITWKHFNGFQKQLELNLAQLRSFDHYPDHWIDILCILKQLNARSIYDVGCGCGAIQKLLTLYFPDLQYRGVDYAEDAINIAKGNWGSEYFEKRDLFDLTPLDIVPADIDVIHAGALLDVLPNGDAALEKLLSFNIKFVLVGRASLIDGKSYYEKYIAYQTLSTCKFYHNKTTFFNTIKRFNYRIYQINQTFLLCK